MSTIAVGVWKRTSLMPLAMLLAPTTVMKYEPARMPANALCDTPTMPEAISVETDRSFVAER